MTLLTQKNKRLLYGSAVILGSIVSLDLLLGLNLLPVGFLNTNFLILVKGLSLWAGILVIGRDL